MGWVKDKKADALLSEAKRALDENRKYFTPRLNTPAFQHNFSGSIAGWAEMIEAIEEAGWLLAEWSVTDDQKGRPEAYPLFRRK